MENKKRIRNFGIFLVLTIFLSSFVLSFGVSSPYWEGKPLRVFPGETETVKLNLQNMVGDEDINVVVSVLRGQEIAEISETEFFVKLGTKDTVIPVVVSIPSETSIGTEYNVTVEWVLVK